MRALILAAGWATRMGDLARARPKHLLPIGRGVALDYAVRAAEGLADVDEIHVVTNERFRADFEAWAAERSPRTPLCVWSDGTRTEAEKLGAIGDIQWFLEQTGSDADLLVLAGDNVFDFSLVPVAEAARREPVVTLYDLGSTERVRRYASVELDADGYVTHFIEKDEAPRATLAAVAIYGFPSHRIGAIGRYLETGGSRDNMGFLIEWLHREMPVRGIVVGGRWRDVGTPDEYRGTLLDFVD